MAVSGAELLQLQANIKKDPDGYKDEFILQYRNYQALLEIFKLKPSKESREFGDRVLFMAQVAKCYPKTMAGFSLELMSLLDTHALLLDTQLRRTLVQALVLLRHRGQLDPLKLMPMLFRLFRCPDKSLRQQIFRTIVADVKATNRKARNERYNRALQNMLYGMVADDNEAAAKRSLAVLTELWRRHVWRDARTVNVIATAAFHKSSRVMLAVMKFFLGQDRDDDSDAEEGEEEGEEKKVKEPSKEDVYKAFHKGMYRTKRKKQAKLKRVMTTVRKQARKGETGGAESFAALHLLHDPQAFAERIFSRLQSGSERFETRMAIMSVVSRIIGVHKLLVLNFYPFLQKYIAPHQRDVTVIIAALVQACHELVPPETLAPVLRQLVDQFVHDKARVEVMTVGLKAVRELCLRCPLVMSEDLLKDLAMYRKTRDKQVSSAARSLITVFREINPAMLAKKDRGRGADADYKPRAYGEALVASRVDGAALLEEALAKGQASDDDDFQAPPSEGDSSDSGELESMSDDGKEEGWEAVSGEAEDEDVGEEEEESSSEFETEEGEDEGSDDGSEDEEGSEDEGASEEDEEPAAHARARSRGKASTSAPGSEDGEEKLGGKRKRQAAQPESLSSLKKRLAEARAKAAEADEEEAQAARLEQSHAGVPIEAERIFSQEDFDRIRRLKHKSMVEAAFSKHGLKTAAMTAAKKQRLLEAAEAEVEELEAMQARQSTLNEERLAPDDLKGRHKARKDKAERLASVMEGREGREKFGAASGMKKKKTGGLSEREKQKRKQMPIAARLSQLRRRHETTKNKHQKGNFRGHVRG